MEMKNIHTRSLLLAFALLLAATTFCQDGQPATITFSIEGLTTEMRDGIARELTETSGLQLTFACVPAGILVFQGNGDPAEIMQDRLSSIMEHRIARQRIRTIEVSRETVEEQCAEARNR